MATLVAGQLIGLMLPLSTPKKKFKLLENEVTGQITKYNQLGRTGRNGLMERALDLEPGLVSWATLNTET